MTVRARLLSVLLALALPSASANAQVNIERLRKGMDGNGAAGALEGSFTGRTGNAPGLVAGAAGHLQWRHALHGGLAFGTGDYAQVNGKTNLSRSVLHARYSYQLSGALWWELYVQQQTDMFRLLRARELLGTGPRLAVLQTGVLDLYLGTAYMIEYETIQVPPGATDAPSSTVHRWSNYVALSLLLDNRITASSITYLQPRFDKPSDYRLLNESSLTVDLASRLATRLSLSVRMDSDPPTTVRPTDVELKNSIVVKF